LSPCQYKDADEITMVTLQMTSRKHIFAATALIKNACVSQYHGK